MKFNQASGDQSVREATNCDITIGNDIARDTHCDIIMGNDLTGDIHCEVIMSNDVDMCIFHSITITTFL